MLNYRAQLEPSTRAWGLHETGHKNCEQCWCEIFLDDKMKCVRFCFRNMVKKFARYVALKDPGDLYGCFLEANCKCRFFVASIIS